MYLYSFVIQHHDDIASNLIASALAFPIELVVTVFIVQRAIGYFENKRWRPARRNVAQKVYDVHQVLFNAAHRIIDPNTHTDKIGHQIPDHVSQDEANYWAKSIFLLPLASEMTALKKAVEFNNSALNSELLPLISDFLIRTEELLSSIRFFIDAYNPKINNTFAGFVPDDALLQMETIYLKVIRLFPEIVKSTASGPLSILSAHQLIQLYREAAQKNPKIELIPKPL